MRIVKQVGAPWTNFRYSLFADDTTRQQARWLLTHRPKAESFWEEADIVHCTMESYVPASRCRLVTTLHDAAYLESNAHARSWESLRQRWKWKFLFSTLSRKVDMFHTVSQFSADRLASFFPSIQTRLRVVHNAVPPRFFEPVSAEGETWLESSGLSKHPYILLPGGLHFRKNAELVLEAWPILRDRFPELRLVISGHSNPNYGPRIGSAGNVEFTGFIDDEMLCSLYHRAALVWFPSLYEGFGIPVVEAMACGAPVVASDCSSVPEVAGGAAILVPPHSPPAHVDAIESVLNSSQTYEDLRHRGLARAGKLSWASSAAQLHGHFQELI
jgi:glycosyltransferase involved in cell wall biosynthesis